MSEDKKEQTVVEKTEAQPEAAAEGSDARKDDLDTLLAEYDKEVKPSGSPSEPERKAEGGKDDAQFLSRSEWDEYQREQRQERIDRELDTLADQIKGEDISASRRLVRGWLEEFAKSDSAKAEALSRAYFQPRSPADRQKVVASLKSAFREEYGATVNAEATEDHVAVAAAVRGASKTDAPEGKPPDYSRMNNQDFNKSVEDQFGFNPGT